MNDAMGEWGFPLSLLGVVMVALWLSGVFANETELIHAAVFGGLYVWVSIIDMRASESKKALGQIHGDLQEIRRQLAAFERQALRT
jgi:hypothetical protein